MRLSYLIQQFCYLPKRNYDSSKPWYLRVFWQKNEFILKFWKNLNNPSFWAFINSWKSMQKISIICNERTWENKTDNFTFEMLDNLSWCLKCNNKYSSFVWRMKRLKVFFDKSFWKLISSSNAVKYSHAQNTEITP